MKPGSPECGTADSNVTCGDTHGDGGYGKREKKKEVAGPSEYRYEIIRNIDVITRFTKSINEFVCNTVRGPATDHELVLRTRIPANRRRLSELE
jgi:hypothetical protein